MISIELQDDGTWRARQDSTHSPSERLYVALYNHPSTTEHERTVIELHLDRVSTGKQMRGWDFKRLVGRFQVQRLLAGSL